MTRGKLFFASRPFIRLMVGRWSVQAPPPEGPTVFVCSHGDMAGPLATQCWLPFPTRPWVLHVFLSREECRRQYRDYTFTQRFGLPRPAAALLAWAVSGYASALVRSVGAIPVYRGSARLKETFRRTVEALQAGDPVIVFPDVDYTDRSGDMGEIYDGFLLIDRFWQRVSDTPLDFVPLRLDRTAPRQGETVRVREALLRGLNGEI